jgi:6-phospho-3-hexuloisomerase
MEFFSQAYDELITNIDVALKGLNLTEVEPFILSLLEAQRNNSKVLIIGAGRSGLVGKAFAMRLMHLGFDVFVLGETITPHVGLNDLVIVISGSGKTTGPLTAANMAKKLDANVVAITSQKLSPLALIADKIVDIPGRKQAALEDEYNSRQLIGQHESLAPMGTLFEVTCMIFLDSVIVELMNRLGLSEESMRERHATIE